MTDSQVISVSAEPQPSSFATVFFIPALAYLALGVLGLSLAITPGYASPIFPAAGFAVAILLWSDKRAWPGIWFGSLLLNLGVAWMQGNLDWRSGLLAAGIATGSTLQALVSRWLVVRSIQQRWQTLELERDITLCLVLAGPISCVISASTGVTLLYVANVVLGSEYLVAWWNWWSGDTLGVLVMLPLSLTVLLRNRTPWRGRMTTLVLPMLLTLGLAGGAFYAVAQWERAQQKLSIQMHGEELAHLLEQRFVAHQEALSALRRLIEVTPDMSYHQFEYFTRITLKDNPDIFALSINPYVLPAQRQAFERSMAEKTGTPGFEIKERDSQRRLVRASERPEYVAVGYIAPLEGNRPAVGYDINSEPVRHDAIQRAKRSGQAAVTAPIQLVQENQKRSGVLLLHPARRLGSVFDTADNQAALMGFAVGVIKVDQMIEIATRTATIEGLVLQVDDAFSPADKARLYRTVSSANPPEGSYIWQRQLPMADRTWTLTVFPTAAYLRQSHHWAALVVGAGGLALASLLQVLLLVTTGRTEVVQRIVREQTTELQVKSEALEDQYAQLNALFTLSPDGFVALAPDGRVKFANPAFQTMTGISSVELIGKHAVDLESALRSHCENPEGFAGISAYFEAPGESSPHRILALKIPRYTVLQINGIRSQSPNVARILYLHDITRESEVDQMKSEFLSHAAHELRTPMSSIYGFSELLLAMDLDEATRRELLETIHRQTKWLVDIVNELLDLSRIESRRGMDFQIGDVDLAALVRDTVAHQTFSETRRIVILDLPEKEKYALADLAKLRQALTNVLSNACKYSPEGSEIRVSIVDTPGRVGIEVRDQGIGMTPEQASHCGERFWRADTSGKTPGTGLGLAIVKEILQLFGGGIEVRSQLNLGTTVILWLSAAKAG